MNATDLQNFLQHPEVLKIADKVALEQLAREYPYFQTAYLLLAKKSQLLNEPSFEAKLNLAATYAVDRVKLYELLHEPAALISPLTVMTERESVVESIPANVSSNDQELDDLLRSIHERKQQILGTGLKEKPSSEIIKEEAERAILNDLRVSGSEFSHAAMEFSEGEGIEAGIDNDELNVIKEMEQEIVEQVAFYRNEEFLLLNETTGGGAEYVPMDELLSEESEDALVEEYDPEMESISVIEEEFIVRDLDQDLKLQELANISEAENYLQLEADNSSAMEITTDAELEALKEIEMLLDEQEAFDRNEELLTINELAGGGSEFTPMELQEESDESEVIEYASEYESLRSLEQTSGRSASPIEITADEKPVEEEGSSLRFSDHVASPGMFLPGKSHSFLDWLQFFKPESKKESPKKPESKPEIIKEAPLYEEKPALDAGMIRTGLQDELETIDRIVSSIRHEPSEKAELLLSPADLARKSLEMDDEMVTETLATIYESQGLFDKAIRMYARLSLKFPEKSLFFAARIKELKSKK